MIRTIRKVFSLESFSVLVFPQFLFFILSVVFSQIAISMLTLVLIFWVFHLTYSNLSVSILVLSLVIPQIFLSFIGGVVGDLRNKKSILFYGNILRAIFLVFLFFGHRKLAPIYFVTFLLSIVTQFYVPSETPVIPGLIRPKYLSQANSVFGIALFGSVLIGYVLAGPAMGVFGKSFVFFMLSALFLLAGFFIKLIPDRYIVRKNDKGIADFEDGFFSNSIKDELKDTLVFLKNTKPIGSAFFLLIFSQVILLVLVVIVPGWAKTILQVPSADLSLILFAPAAVGTILASFFAGGFLKDRNKEKLMTLGLFLAGVSILFLPYMNNFGSKSFVFVLNSFIPGRILDVTFGHLTITLAFLIGFSYALIFVPAQTILQQHVSEPFRAKMYGLIFSLIGIVSLLPVVISGGIADAFGVGKVLIGMGVLIIMVSLIRIFTTAFDLKFFQS